MHVPISPAPSSGDLDQFDSTSGSLLERALFNHRTLVLLLCLAATLLLGWQATRLTLNASFEKMIPREHPFIVNYLEHRQELAGLG
ncbi:MAG: RND family transporter, partial [Pseudomonas sp.]